MIPLAQLADLQALIPGWIDAEDEARALALLDHASSLVRAHCGKTFTTTDGSALAADLPAAVVTITLQCARRAFQNPDGVIATTVAGYSERVAEQAAEGLYLSEAERKILDRAIRGTSSGGLWVQPTTRGEEQVEPMFLIPTSTGGDPIEVVPPEWMR